jgi:hypothetical protein
MSDAPQPITRTHSQLVALDTPLPAQQASSDGAHALFARPPARREVGVAGPGVHLYVWELSKQLRWQGRR